jgi:DNA-directed RNA polymerase specialized sigma24 family protein
MNKIIQELKDYALWKDSLEIIPQRIAEIDERMQSLGGGKTDTPVKNSGTNKQEEKLCQCIDEKTELLKTLELRTKKKEYIEKGLAHLTEEEQKVLDIFYMRSLKYGEAVNVAMIEMNMSEKSVDRTRRSALRKYSLCEFGK